MGIGVHVLAACGAVIELSPIFAKQFCINLLPPVFNSFLWGNFFMLLTFLLVPAYCTAVARNETSAYMDGTLANFLKQLFYSFCTVRSFPFG